MGQAKDGKVTVRKYRLDLYDSILRQDLCFFDRKNKATGSLVSRLSTQPTQLHDLLGFNIAILVIAVVNLVASCMLAFIVGWKLGLVLAFAGLPILVMSGFIRIRLETKLQESTAERFSVGDLND